MEIKSKILIIDDERFYINVLVELLQDSYKIYIAKSGEKTLKRIADNLPDLILLDVMMPDMDGYQTCMKIKQQTQCKDIPVIFLTGKTDQESEAKAFEYGAADFISKPISPQAVKAKIKVHLSLLHVRHAAQKNKD